MIRIDNSVLFFFQCKIPATDRKITHPVLLSLGLPKVIIFKELLSASSMLIQGFLS